MKSFKKFLSESRSLTGEELPEFETDLETVVENCSEYIQEVGLGSDRLYRGINNPLMMEFKNIRKNRDPLDTQLKIHQMFDRYFEENYGLKWRSQSVQAKKRRNGVHNFGIPHVIFPVNGYQVLWSPFVGDLTVDFTAEFEQKFGKNPKKEVEIDFIEYEQVKQVLDGFKYERGNLSDYFDLKTGREIMIAGSGYYAFVTEKEEPISVYKEMEEIAKEKGIIS